MIRNSAKAILIRDSKILLIRNRSESDDWYTLPGGGQEKFETLQAALKRECLEEAGLAVEVGELLFVREYIARHHEFASKEPEVHQIEFHFRCNVDIKIPEVLPQIPDREQIGIEWVDVKALRNMAIYPKLLRQLPDHMAGQSFPVYLGDLN